MNKYYHIFTLFGIPVSASLWFALLVVVLSVSVGDIQRSILFGIVTIFAVLGHEFGHALVSKHYRLAPQIALTGLGGITAHNSATPKQSFFITLMGPLTNLLFSGIAFGSMALLIQYAPEFISTHNNLGAFLTFSCFVNLAWGIFNLLPIYPMDGGKIMSAILVKFLKPRLAIRVGLVLSIICCAGILAYFAYERNMFMVFIAFYLMVINVSGARRAFASTESRQQEQLSLQAEAIYELGRTAANEHRWVELERYGHQMKEVANSPDQIRRAYDLLTIACTNEFKYKEALEYSKRASDSEAIKLAVERCKTVLSKENDNL